MQSCPNNETALFPLHTLVPELKLAEGADEAVFDPHDLPPAFFMTTRILLDSRRGSTLPFVNLQVAVIVRIDEPVPQLTVAASGFSGNVILIPVMGYVCPNTRAENSSNSSKSFGFI